MRIKTNLIILMSIVAVSMFTSCKSSLNLSVLQPADINIPSDIKKLAVVNRSIAGKDEQLMNVVEGLLTGEGIAVDREASNNCVNGLVYKLSSSPRFTIVAPNEYQLRGTGTSQWPVALDWDLVMEICKKHGADALITIETFDSDQVVRLKEVKRSKKVDDKTVEYIEHVAKMDVRVDAGWRIYDPYTKTVIDENVYVDHKYFDASGSSPDNARRNLIPNRKAVLDAGYFAGTRYAYRISPLWVKVPRSYYTKGNDDIEKAKRYVKSNQWDEAIATWSKHVDDADDKIAGKAMYNLALGYEVKGDLDKALEWAKKSYVLFPKGSTQTYIRTIKRRMYDQQRLDQQMGE